MFKQQASQLRNAESFDDIAQVITGCGPLERDTDGFTSHTYGDSSQTAGINEDHAIVKISQYNQQAGTSKQPKLWALWVEGPVKFEGNVSGIMRHATATANWNSAASTVAATDNATGIALTINLYADNARMQPNVRSGDTVRYWFDLSGNPYSASNDKRIGEIDWVTNTNQIRGGWQVADGTNGTVDLTGNYPLGHATTAGTTSGSGVTGSGNASITMSGSTGSTSPTITMGGTTANATVSLSGSVSSNTISLAAMVSDTASTNINTTNNATVPHSNGIDLDNTGAASYVSSLTSNGDHSHSITEVAHSHNFTNSTAVGSHTHGDTFALTNGNHNHGATGLTATDAGHNHSATGLISTDSGHTHTFTPPSCTVIPIQRIS